MFFRWSPHAYEIEYATNGGKWDDEGLKTHRVGAYLDRPDSIDTMKYMRDHLQQMLAGANEQDAMGEGAK